MAIEIVYETHSTSEDNERGVASGWAHSCLSATGRAQARALGARRRNDRIGAVFSSDLRRAVETADPVYRAGDRCAAFRHLEHRVWLRIAAISISP